MESTSSSHPSDAMPTGGLPIAPMQPQFMLEFLIPGFSVFSTAIRAYLGIDLNLYIPLLLVASGLTVAWSYLSGYIWELTEKHLMSVVRIRTDDEIYNIVMGWVASQNFSQQSRNFIANTNVNSRSWSLWHYTDDDEEEDDEIRGSDGAVPSKKPLLYTPSFGSHFFWYRSNLLLFERHENRESSGYLTMSEREEISISSFGRNPRILKELLIEARQEYSKRDERKTCIYRGTTGGVNSDPSWQRCMSRSTRPFPTVILNEKVKQNLIDDVSDYMHPATQRWYSNRGIPYRRGYLLYGPPGTGKSSLSLALAGYFQMRIYMVSLSSGAASEETLSTLFSQLPRRCVVLLEDIDTAGLTHTREEGKQELEKTTPTPTSGKTTSDRLSLSGLLNILDGVASQEGRILIMTTNHLEKLDKALIRPGRVDMMVEFGLADFEICASIFKAIYAPYEAEEIVGGRAPKKQEFVDVEEQHKATEMEKKQRQAMIAHISALADKFAAKIPEYEFSPAEVQGLLLKHKRDPEMVIERGEEWVVQMRKEKKQKDIEEAEKRRKEEASRKKKEEEEREKEEKKKTRKSKKSVKRKSKKDESDGDSGSASGSNDSATTDSEKEGKKQKKSTNKKTKTKQGVENVEEEGASDKTKEVDGDDDNDEGSRDADAESENENERVTDTSASTTFTGTVVTSNGAVEKRQTGHQATKSTSDSGYETPDREQSTEVTIQDVNI